MIPAIALFFAGCIEDTEPVWEQYNADDNSVVIAVGQADLLPDVEIVLTSSSGTIPIGVGSVSPGGGPIGTLHAISVVVDGAYAAEVDRAAIRTDSEGRGEDEYDLDADSAGEGYWYSELESVGSDGESRSDTLTFRLYQEVESSDDGTGS